MTPTRVLVFGTFDGFHPGHRFVLEQASARGELWVVVARDRNVERIKGRTTKHSEEERLATVTSAFPAAHVVLGNPTDFQAPLREIKPDLILLGYDQRLPPGVTDQDFPCPVERLPAFYPDKFKSSLLNKHEKPNSKSERKSNG